MTKGRPYRDPRRRPLSPGADAFGARFGVGDGAGSCACDRGSTASWGYPSRVTGRIVSSAIVQSHEL
jgi:hypothetical protein